MGERITLSAEVAAELDGMGGTRHEAIATALRQAAAWRRYKSELAFRMRGEIADHVLAGRAEAAEATAAAVRELEAI